MELLYLKFNSINPDFEGGMPSSHVIIGLLTGEKKPFFFPPLIFFPGLFLKTKSAEGNGTVVDFSF